MNVTIIAAMSLNRVIGHNNDLIWHLPADLKHFKTMTSGHHIIMGRKTFESVGRPLPNRTNIIVTRQKDYKIDGCIVVNTIEEAIAVVKNDEQPFITGGAEIYRQSFDFADTIELTLVHQEFEGDTYFPEFNKDEWKETQRILLPADEKNSIDMEFLRYEKIKP